MASFFPPHNAVNLERSFITYMSISTAMLSCCSYRPSAWRKTAAVSPAAQVERAVAMKWKAGGYLERRASLQNLGGQ
jgi:hypothetical protein